MESFWHKQNNWTPSMNEEYNFKKTVYGFIWIKYADNVTFYLNVSFILLIFLHPVNKPTKSTKCEQHTSVFRAFVEFGVALPCRNLEQRPLWDRVEKLQSRPGSGSSSNSSSQASPGERFRPRCESPGTVHVYFFYHFSVIKTTLYHRDFSFHWFEICNLTKAVTFVVIEQSASVCGF